jgi:cyclophilin family peptidyl-prolyl cis-trans isomerase
MSLTLLSCADKKDKAISQIDAFIAEQKIDKADKYWKNKVIKPPQVKFSIGKKYYWDLKTTEGDMQIEFLPLEAPMHVSSTIYLTNLGFYDDIIFHRVITGFMAQGGDPTGTGMGGPAYKYDGEYKGPSKHDKAGTLSMANAGAGTDGSQFFLTFKATPHINGKHTVFGYLTQGLDVLKKIEELGSRTGKTSKEVKIITAKISVK